MTRFEAEETLLAVVENIKRGCTARAASARKRNPHMDPALIASCAETACARDIRAMAARYARFLGECVPEGQALLPPTR